jgi:hypothetical protein
MANEITYATRIAWNRGGESISLSASDTYTQLGNVAIGNIQYVGLTSSAILFGNVLDPCFVSFRNEAPKVDLVKGIPLVQVYLGVVTPMTSIVATIVLDGGQGIAVPNGGIIWYALSTAANTPLAVVAIER